MEFFWFFVFLLVIILYFNHRVGNAERRIYEIERGLHAPRPQEQASTQAAPLSTEELSRVGVHAGEIFQRAYGGAAAATPAPAPAPAPMPMYSKADMADIAIEKPKFTDETKEETSARWLGRIGAFAVLIGVALFLKYAFDNNWIGPTGRVALGIIAGLAMIGVGQKLRAKYLNYSDIVMGCGIGILYLSIYASYGFYHLVDPSVAFVLMGLVTMFGLVLAMAGSSMGLAILATLGGFMTPVLLSTGENHLVALSIFMIILDLGVLGVAWFKKWTPLYYLSFIGTIFLFSGWIEKFYTPEQFGLTFFFVTVFFLIFLVTSILHHLVRKEPATSADLILLVLNAAGYFGVASWLLDPLYHDTLGFFALLLAVLYLGVAYVAFTSNRSDRTLNLFLPGIAVVFLTIAIPLQLDGYYVSLSWLVEALVLTAIGLYLRERVIQVFGWIVLTVGMISMGQDVWRIRAGIDEYGRQIRLDCASPCSYHVTPFWNMGFFLMMVAIAVFYGIAALYHRFREEELEWRKVALFSVVMANIVTLFSFASELSLEHRYIVSIVWFIESLVLLVIGLREKNRIVEVLGWIVLFCGLATMWDGVMGIRSGLPEVTGAALKNSPLPLIPFANTGFLLMVISVATFYTFVGAYFKLKDRVMDWKKIVSIALVLANILTIAVVTSEIEFKYDQDVAAIYKVERDASQAYNNYTGGTNYANYGSYNLGYTTNGSYSKIAVINSSKNAAVSIFWALYAILLIAVGFAKRMRMIRLFGLIFFFVTAARVFLEVWQLGQLQRIISSIVFGVIALGASFLYVKYKDRLKEIVLSDA